MAPQVIKPDAARVSGTTEHASDDSEVIYDLSYSYCALRPHLYLSADDIALIEAARLANGYGHSCSDAAVHGTSDSAADDTPDQTPEDTPDGSSNDTPSVTDYCHDLIDAMSTTRGVDAQCECRHCGGHGVDHVHNDLRGLYYRCYLWSPKDEYPPELDMGDECEEAEGLPPSAIANRAFAAERPDRLPDLFRILPPASAYNCATESLGCLDLRIGWFDHIPRWKGGSELSYIVCTESFPPELSSVVEDAMKTAISWWQGIGVSFKQVPRDSRATFAIRFDGSKYKIGYAESFIPDNTRPLALFVHEKSRSKAEYLPNILAHEIGHILGLRHGFAHKKKDEAPSVFFGSEDDRSVMNYYDHPGKLQVSERDRQGLRAFYEYDQPEYDGHKIVDVEPGLHDLSEATIPSPTMRESAADTRAELYPWASRRFSRLYTKLLKKNPSRR